MARPPRPRPVLATLAALVIVALSVSGCVSLPAGGPVQSYPVTQESGPQSQQYMQIQPQPPGRGWNPEQIVQGFLTASASVGDYGQVVKQYMTPQFRKSWNVSWSAVVYKSGPNVKAPVYPTSKNPTTASVQVTGKVQAVLVAHGSYSVQSGSSQDAQYSQPVPIELQKVNGQWRISYAPKELLLTSDSFARDFHLQNLYFFDPTGKYLVPDPVYVPLGARPEDLVNGLVSDLIQQPKDWLSGAARTAFPANTKISKNGIEVNGATAVVNLTGAITKASDPVMERVSAQLLSTLRGAAQDGPTGPPVQSVEVLRNGKPWAPPDSQDNPVQQTPMYSYSPPASSTFYYIDSSGYLDSRTTGGGPRRIAKIGTGFSQIAVSPDGTYVAALNGTTLYAGLIGHRLTKWGSGYVSMSWDDRDDLWASGDNGAQIVMFRGPDGARHPFGQVSYVNVILPPASDYPVGGPPYMAIKVAPDGVRVALVEAGGENLTFGAISGLSQANPKIRLSTVQESPPSQSVFTALAWYGANNVIALATGPTVTEYPVSGGTPTSIPTDPGIRTIAASSGEPLIAELPKGQLATNASLRGSWLPLASGGTDPVYPG